MDDTWTEDGPAPSRPGTAGTADHGGELLSGRYRLEALLGRGGMGTVYRAWDTWLDEHVAVKLLHTDSERLRRALVREVKLARKISHPGVMRVHDLGRDGDRLFLVMEFVAGRSLGHDLADHGPLGLAEAVEIARAVAVALAAAHAAGVVHCDLKPDNVMLCDDGRIVLGDFGIARAAGEQRAVVEGTPAYMAPEQRQRGELDARTDLFAFGQLLVAMLTGRPSAQALDRFRPALDVELPSALSELIRACMQSTTGGRFSSVEELLPVLDLEIPADPGTRRRPAPLRPSGAMVLGIAVPADPVLAGVVEEIADRLRRVRGLAVRVGESGDARLALDVRPSGDVHLVLTDAAGLRLWSASETAANARSPVFVGAAAGAVAVALHRPAPRPARADPERDGFELYLQARHALRQGWATDVSRATSLLEVAAQKLPDDPRIRATRMLARARALFFTADRTPGLFEAAIREAEGVLEGAADRVDAWEAAARTALVGGRPELAVPHLVRGLARFPGSSQLHGLMGVILSEAGALDRALHHVEQSRWLDPTDEGLVSDHAHVLALCGRFDDALALLATEVHGQDARALEESRLMLWSGRLHRELPTAHLPAPLARMVHATVEIVRTGTVPPETFEMLDRLQANAASPRFAAALAQREVEFGAAAGDLDRATAALARGVEGALCDLPWLDACPVLGTLRADPRVGPLRDRVARRSAEVLAAVADAEASLTIS